MLRGVTRLLDLDGEVGSALRGVRLGVVERISVAEREGRGVGLREMPDDARGEPSSEAVVGAQSVVGVQSLECGEEASSPALQIVNREERADQPQRGSLGRIDVPDEAPPRLPVGRSQVTDRARLGAKDVGEGARGHDGRERNPVLGGWFSVARQRAARAEMIRESRIAQRERLEIRAIAAAERGQAPAFAVNP